MPLAEILFSFGVRERLEAWSAARWRVIALGMAVLGGSLTGMGAYRIATPSWRLFWLAVGVAFGTTCGVGLVFGFYLLLRQGRESREAAAQLRALVNIRPLGGFLPFDLGGWAADPVLVDTVTRILCDRAPRLVVECGSGWSTVLIAACLRELGRGRVVALEHLEHQAAKTRRLLRSYGATECGEVVFAPLEERRIGDREWIWYGAGAEKAIDRSIDVLVVDGPPGNVARRSRYPAVPVLMDQLAKQCTVILDDGRRDDETWIALRWGEDLGVEAQLIPAGKGVWLLSTWDGSLSDPTS